MKRIKLTLVLTMVMSIVLLPFSLYPASSEKDIMKAAGSDTLGTVLQPLENPEPTEAPVSKSTSVITEPNLTYVEMIGAQAKAKGSESATKNALSNLDRFTTTVSREINEMDGTEEEPEKDVILLEHGDVRYLDGKDVDVSMCIPDDITSIIEVRKYYAEEEGQVQPEYEHPAVQLSADDIDLLERLVYGEAGDQDFAGQALVVQCIRDTMVQSGHYSVPWIIKTYRYSGSTKRGTSERTKRAVQYVINGGYVIPHRVIYFYDWIINGVGGSKFHESQNFLLQWGCHRFFDEWPR